MEKNVNKNEVKISNDIKISKTLSWLLRHGAIRENLPITNDGYLEVDILLSHPSLVRLHCKHDDILRIVENDKKRRYTLAKCPTSDNKLRIKANQGHSMIEIDNLTLKRITNPSEISNIIHGTYYRYLDSIKKEGLKTMKRNFIHFTEKENFHENLSGFRGNCEILIYLDSAKAMKNGIEFYKSENNVILSSGINGSYVDINICEKCEFSYVYFEKNWQEKNIRIEMTDDQQHTENEQTQTANQTRSSSNKFKCKSCIAEFNTLNQCLSHELFTHINMFETKCKRKQSNRCGKRKKQSSHDYPETKYLQNTVIAILSQCPEGKELDYLCRIFQPNPEDFSSLYHSVLVDLNADLMKSGKQWEIKPFGSTIMGLEFKESDFDFLVYPLDEEVNYQNSDNVYKQVEKVIRHSKHFSRVITIPKARVPIIKCTHNVTQYNLDINVSSVLGVNSSKFIVKLFELDSRIHPLMLIIKIWAKYWNISGTGRITNYCLTLMIIAYLQNMKPTPILPSIQELQNNTEQILVEGINYAFNENYINENGKKNHKNIKELLHGFFEFYSKFDFSSNIISTYLGKMINRNDFQTKKFVFPEYDKLMDYLKVKYPPTNIKRELHCEPIKLDSLIVIQDPFCLNHNNSSPVGKSIFDSFRIHLANGYRICSEFLSSSSTTNQRTSELLLRLFFERPISPQSSVPKFTVNAKLISPNGELKKENTVSISTTTFATTTTTTATCSYAADTTAPTNARATARNNESFDISSLDVDKCMALRIKPIEVELMYVRTYLRKAFPNKSFNKIDINKFWIEKIIEFTRNILHDIFQIEIIDCNTEENSPNSKISRTNLQQTHIYHNNNNKIDDDDDDDDLKRLTMICELKATIDTWSSRKNDVKKLATYLNEQLEMTKNFQNIRTADKFPANLHCKLCLKPEQNFCALSLTMKDLMPNKSTNESVTMQQNKSNMKIFFTQYTSRMSYFHKAYFEKLATSRK